MLSKAFGSFQQVFMVFLSLQLTLFDDLGDFDLALVHSQQSREVVNDLVFIEEVRVPNHVHCQRQHNLGERE